MEEVGRCVQGGAYEEESVTCTQSEKVLQWAKAEVIRQLAESKGMKMREQSYSWDVSDYWQL
jgi:hypothetical protein